jgi:hypothetical protein
MPISHRHKTIFVHIPKTAGTSVEIILGVGGINESYLRSHKESVINGVIFAPQHYTAKMLKSHKLVQSLWNNYFKFSIVRNPYTRVLSEYFWVKGKTRQNLTFNPNDFTNHLKRYYSKIDKDHKLSQTHYLYDNDKCLVEKVFKFENLKDGFGKFALKKWPSAPKLMHTHRSSNKTDYLGQLTQYHKDFIYELYDKDFKNFNYQR